MENNLHTRCCFCIDDIISVVQTVRAEVSSVNNPKDGKIVFSLSEGEDIVNMADIYIPLKRIPEKFPEGYDVKPKIYLANAVKTRYEGNLFCIHDSIIHLEQYIKKMDLIQITGGNDAILIFDSYSGENSLAAFLKNPKNKVFIKERHSRSFSPLRGFVRSFAPLPFVMLSCCDHVSINAHRFKYMVIDINKPAAVFL